MAVYNPDNTSIDFRSAYTYRRVIVLGATGFIGRWVARALSQQGADLYLFLRDPTATKELFSRYAIRGKVCLSDLVDLVRVQKEIKALQPDVLFNLAGYGVDRSENDELITYRINAELIEAVCEALADIPVKDWSGQRVVHIGSALEYGEIQGDLNENSSPFPTTLYGKSKLAGTLKLKNCCQAHQLPGLTVRLFTIYGPGEHPTRLLPTLLKAADHDEEIPLTAGEQKRDFTFVADVAEGLLRLGVTRTPPGEIVNLATGELTSVKSFVLTAAEILGIPSDRLLFGGIPTRQEEMNHDPVSIRRMVSLLDWKPSTTISQGVRQTLDFYCNHQGGVYG